MFRKGRPDSPKPTYRLLRLGIYSELKCTRHKARQCIALDVFLEAVKWDSKTKIGANQL